MTSHRPVKKSDPKLLAAQPRKRGRGRPSKNPPVILCDICKKNPACWQRPVRLENGELLVHCDMRECDSAYIKLVYRTRMPFTQIGFLAETARASRQYGSHDRTPHPSRRPKEAS